MCSCWDERLDGLPCLTADLLQRTVLLLGGDGGVGSGGRSLRWAWGWGGYSGEPQFNRRSQCGAHCVRAERCGGGSCRQDGAGRHRWRQRSISHCTVTGRLLNSHIQCKHTLFFGSFDRKSELIWERQNRSAKGWFFQRRTWLCSSCTCVHSGWNKGRVHIE